MQLARPPKNKFEEAYLAFDEKTIIRVFDIKVPFVYKFTVGLDQSWYTEWEYHVKKPEDFHLVKEDIKKRRGHKVMKIEPSIRKIIDLCPRCHMRGTPKIEKKDANDRRARRPTHLGEIEKGEIQIERPEEHWLVYNHPKNKRCKIRQYVNTPDPAYKKNDIDVEKYFFPWAIQHLKDGTIWYAN